MILIRKLQYILFKKRLAKTLIPVYWLPIFLITQSSVKGIPMVGSFDLTSNSPGSNPYNCSTVNTNVYFQFDKIMEDGSYTIVKDNFKDAFNNRKDEDFVSYIRFSLPAVGSGCPGFDGYSTKNIPLEEVVFGPNWEIEQLKFLGYSDPLDPRFPGGFAEDYIAGVINFTTNPTTGTIYYRKDLDKDMVGSTPDTPDPGDSPSGDTHTVTRTSNFTVTKMSDFGDAPESYKTKLDPSDPEDPFKGGPRYDEGDLQRLGNNWDGEPDGQPTEKANGDDINLLGGFPKPVDDEDGVIFGNSWVDVIFNINRPQQNQYQLRAWWDLNRNGMFDHPTEMKINDLLGLTAGRTTKRYNNLGFNPKEDRLYSRFRLTWDPDGDVLPVGEVFSRDCPDPNNPVNCISHGEVEDYVEILEPNLALSLLTLGTFGIGLILKQK